MPVDLPEILLIQARQFEGPNARHEVDCVVRRIGVRPVRLRAVNALVESADPGWLDGVSAVVIGGSGSYSVHHPRSARWVEPLRRIVDLVVQRSIPTFGVCFGHQLLGYHLGVEVQTGPEQTENGTIQIEATPEGLTVSRSRYRIAGREEPPGGDMRSPPVP